MELPISFDAAVDHFYRPKLARAVQCSVERIVVRLGPSLEKFEDELSVLVQNEYCRRQTVQASGSAQVIKRYMQVLFAFFVEILSLFHASSHCLCLSVHPRNAYLSICLFVCEKIPKMIDRMSNELHIF